MTKLDLNAYARVLAHVACRRGASLAGILAQLKIGHDEFREAEAELCEELASLWDHRKGVVAMRFAAALGAELRRLGPLGSEGEGSTPPEMVPRPDALPEPHGTELPSFLRDRAHARDEIVARDVSNLAPDPAPRELLPLVPAPPSSLHSGPTEDDQRAESRGQRVGTGTAEMDLSAAMAAAKKSLTPFVRSESAAGHAPGGVAGDVDLTQMPLEVYAAISGALARGEAREEVLRRYGVNAEVFGKLASGWAPRFEREPHLYARFVELARRPPSTSGG